MATVLTQCPATGKVVPVGFEANRESFAAGTVMSGSYHCPHCNAVHRWIKQDAWVVASPPPSDTPRNTDPLDVERFRP